MEKDILQYHRWGGSRGRSWNGCQQKAISAKLDNIVSDMVDSETKASGMRRNSLINLSLKWYLEELDEARRLRALGTNSQKYILKLDLTDLTGQELEYLEFISRSFGCTIDVVVMNALRVMLHEYNKNPMKYTP